MSSDRLVTRCHSLDLDCPSKIHGKGSVFITMQRMTVEMGEDKWRSLVMGGSGRGTWPLPVLFAFLAMKRTAVLYPVILPRHATLGSRSTDRELKPRL